jgi:segregation and condensation protein B
MLQRHAQSSPMNVYPRNSLSDAAAAIRSGLPVFFAWPGHHATLTANSRRAQASMRSGRGGVAIDAVDSTVERILDTEDESPTVRRKRAEAVLLFHRGPVNLRKLAALAGLADATEARTRIREMNQIYDQTGSALRVEEVAGGHQLLTRPALAPWLRRIKHIPPPVHLGDAAMETLAIIAYRQPVLRADVEAIRGVACGELIRQLMQRDLVRISGRSEDLGRPYLYGTTPYFLQIFGLKNMGSIPALPGASIPDDSEDTLANQDDTSQATATDSPIEPPMNVEFPAPSPFDVVTPKESDVSIAPGPVVFDEVADFLKTDSNIAIAERPLANMPDVVAVDDDEDEDYFDDDEDDDVVDDEDEDDWDDDEEEDDVEEDDDAEDAWEEVGDEDEVEEDEVDVEEVEDEEEEDEEAEDDLEEDDVWDDDEDDDDWEEDDDEEEWD